MQSVSRIQAAEDQPLTAEQRVTRRVDCLKKILFETSLASWVMKPLFCSRGMKEGSSNEMEVLKALKNFMAENRAMDGDSF